MRGQARADPHPIGRCEAQNTAIEKACASFAPDVFVGATMID
jgi:hypothetical protein